jgi:hypothetical protein
MVLFSTPEFDAALVDVATVRFAGAYAFASALEDVDGDGDLDLVLRFRTPSASTRFGRRKEESELSGSSFLLPPSSFGARPADGGPATWRDHFTHSRKITGGCSRKSAQNAPPSAASPSGDTRGRCQWTSRKPAARNASSCVAALSQ